MTADNNHRCPPFLSVRPLLRRVRWKHCKRQGNLPFNSCFVIPVGIGARCTRRTNRLNDEALVNGERILSAYRTCKGVKLWVITEADRSSTCILLPEEY